MNAMNAARRARNLSLSDIAARTRITHRYIEAIDEGRLSELPGGLYGRAYVRAVASVVGLGKEELDEVLATLAPAPDPLPVLEEVVAQRTSRSQMLGDMRPYVAVVADAAVLLAVSAIVVAAVAGACGVPVGTLVTLAPVPIFVLCAMTWVIYFILLAGVHGCTAGQSLCGMTPPHGEAPLRLSVILQRTLVPAPCLYSRRWYGPRWSRGHAT